ncbi:hypothetical protein LIER_02733 [Lithospermum erythrorhizon]|uniref:Uncharacterized protein n=1 Tax=Lithospermum erythrorhizon TaxID=34254 RepID=A0AAV3NQI4_LITER
MLHQLPKRKKKVEKKETKNKLFKASMKVTLMYGFDPCIIFYHSQEDTKVVEVKNFGDDEDKRRIREAVMRRRLDINKHPVDVGELHPNIETEDLQKQRHTLVLLNHDEIGRDGKIKKGYKDGG